MCMSPIFVYRILSIHLMKKKGAKLTSSLIIIQLRQVERGCAWELKRQKKFEEDENSN